MKTENRRQRTEDRKQNTALVSSVLFILCVFLLIQSGCMVGPNYQAPKQSVPAKWTGAVGPLAGEKADTVLIQWWNDFNDPNLTSLVERAVASNLDLRQAEERIRQARASRRVITAGFWPTADATATLTRSRTPPSITGPATMTNLFQSGLDAAWELDIFGGTRRNIESADADIQAAVEDRRDVLVTLVSEVALNYVQLRGFQQEILIAEKNLKAQQNSAEVVRKRYEGGFVSALDLANADAQVATTLSQIPTLQASARQTINNIALLLGQQPQSLPDELSSVSSIPPAPPEIPAGLPSEILRRRPDIRRAEARAHSATAQIGVATADLFPKFNLTGSLSFRGTNANVFFWDKRSWSFGPSADWQIFNAGSVSANIEVQKALTQQALIEYEKTVLTALNEVENALITYSNEQQRNKALLEAVTQNRKAVEISTKLYSEGQTDFLSVLDAQRSLYSSQDALVQSNRNLSTDLISLYKALGGGWDFNDVGQ